MATTKRSSAAAAKRTATMTKAERARAADKLVVRLIAAFAEILDVPASVDPLPVLKWNGRMRALGGLRCQSAEPFASFMFLKPSLLEDPDLLGRVVAHEMVHHWVKVRSVAFARRTTNPAAYRMAVAHVLGDGYEHGKLFKEGVKKIEAVAGKGYVVVNAEDE